MNLRFFSLFAFLAAIAVSIAGQIAGSAVLMVIGGVLEIVYWQRMRRERNKYVRQNSIEPKA